MRSSPSCTSLIVFSDGILFPAKLKFKMALSLSGVVVLDISSSVRLLPGANRF